MIIKQEVIDNIKEDKRLKAQLCAVFNKHFGTVERWINMNIDNGPLTTTAAMKIIKEETGLSEEQILEQEPATASA